MPDRDSVINGLDEITHYDGEQMFYNDIFIRRIADDALALLKEDCHNCKLECLLQRYDQLKEKYDKLLKEQEAVKPKSKVRHGANAQIQHFCGNCNTMLHGKPKYCSECGKGVLW